MSKQSPRVREPVVAGRFYEGDRSRLEAEARRLVGARLEASVASRLPARLSGAMAPHAGWICSGRLAGLALGALASRTEATTVFLTGSVHTIDLEGPALDESDAWRTPLGEVEVDRGLREAVGELAGFGVVDGAHRSEHALEVELPLMQVLWGEGLRIVPCMIPPSAGAPAWGEALGAKLADWSEPVAVVVSSDLTHYGPNYGFAPRGVGEAGRRWALEENDRSLLSRVEALDAAGALSEAMGNGSACGGGAIAATLAAARGLGAGAGYVLEHSDSTGELAASGYDDPSNSVGYAAAVFG